MKRLLKTGRPLITFRDATLQLRDRRILTGIDWSIRSNEHWAIVGANGSGKSVLARALHGVVPIVGGEVEYHFFDHGTPENCIAHVSFEDQRHLVGMASAYHQSRWNSTEGGDALTVMDVLSGAAADLSPQFSRESHAEQMRRLRQRRVVKQLGIGHLLDRKIPHLSNGEARKVLIARALLGAPLILILDDPFVGLDYRSRRALRKMIGELMRGAMRIVFVTSRIDELPTEITHALWLKDGRIAAGGDKKSVLIAMRAETSSARRKPVPQLRNAATGRPRRASPKAFTLVEIRNASVVYDGVEVLSGIDWNVTEGQHWAVLGPNGSGKTTLLSLILADNPQAYSNDVRLFGKKRGSGESIWDIKKSIGWVSPEIQVHYQRNMTSHDVVCSGFFDSIGLYRERSVRQASLATGWMKSLGLSVLADRRFDELSSGQQRMALVARASVKNPRLLILDEPCQGLDLENRRVVLDAIDAIGRHGRSTIIYVTHRLNEIPGSITHVLRLRKGRVARKGERESVLGR